MGGERPFQDIIKDVMTTGYRTLVLTIDDADKDLPMIAEAVQAVRMDLTPYFLVLVCNVDVQALKDAPVFITENAAVKKLLQGSLTLQPMDCFVFLGERDAFLQTWRSLNRTFVDRVVAANPVPKNKPGYYVSANADDYLKAINPTFGTGYLSDVIFSVGMGLCEARAATDPGAELTAAEITTGIRSVRFVGATGRTRYASPEGGLYPGSREGPTAIIGALNIDPGGELDSDG